MLVYGPDGNIKTTVYRKATNTRRILHFKSNHPVGHKRSCVRTLFQRVQTHCSDDNGRKEEIKYLHALFKANGYPKSFIRKYLKKPYPERSDGENPKFWLAIPYVKNVSEATSRILKPLGIGVAHKPASTIRQQIIRPKDPLPVTEQSAVAYSIPCQDCDARYVGETGKRLGTRLHEHQLAINRKNRLSLVHGHTLERNHNFAFEKARVVGRANDKMARLMLESWSSSGTLNRAIDLHPAYRALRARLESVRAGPMARMKSVTRGRLPTLAERGEGADRKSRDRRGTLSHGRTREAGNTTPQEQRSISPPSNEGEANEHADAAATTLGVRETQGTPVRQWLRSERPQSANKKQANQRVRGKLLKWIQSFLLNRCQTVHVGGQQSTELAVESGVPQGSVLGPTLFIIYVNDCVSELDCGVAMFADDIKLWSVIRTADDEEHLQANLNRLQQWSKDWLLPLNEKKCNIQRVGRAHSPNHIAYCLNGIPLQKVDSQKDLGVWITTSLKPSLHCTKIAKSAMSVLYLVKRAFSAFDEDCLAKVFRTFVWPQLEFVIQAWRPWTAKDLSILERVQRRATKLVEDRVHYHMQRG
ncbi:hypothetical protein SprV_0802488500 [Sparganum proliferum]